jgi:chromosome segregation ATPase
VERETALQRWAVALELEAARQATAAGQLAAQEGKLSRLAAEAAEGKQSAQNLLADVATREQRLQQEAAEVEQLHSSVELERAALVQERAALEGAAAELAQRAADIARREAVLSAAEEEWATKVEAAKAQFKVGKCCCLRLCRTRVCFLFCTLLSVPSTIPQSTAGPRLEPSPSRRPPARRQPWQSGR